MLLAMTEVALQKREDWSNIVYFHVYVDKTVKMSILRVYG